MPTYAYRCRKCGHGFEDFHGIRDDKPRYCPRCRGRAERVPTGGAGLLFKGSGFHITDYRSKSYRDKARQEGSSGGGSGSAPAAKTGGGSGSAPAAKTGGGSGSAPAAKRGGGKPSAD